jgi:serine/threonine-protein kinase
MHVEDRTVCADEDETREIALTLVRPREVSLTPSGYEGASFGQRYRPQQLIAEGGMGEIRLVRDMHVGREVAMKQRRRDRNEQVATDHRFIREARIQGQLEHPSIVPVYDLATTPEGTQYFTMRHVHGSTLREIIERLTKTPPADDPRFSRRRLLMAFANVCLAVDFAHQRGIIHRDIKPSNIMLGDFGEVYLLDWGLAKIVGPDPVISAEEPSRPETRAGVILGTAGYMSPEQTKPDSAEVNRRADIYALGAVLFEILTLERLHPADSMADKIRSTQMGANARARIRAPHRDVPPELEAVCVKATALNPSDRFWSARDIHDAIERYLDGDRDLEIRKETAKEHVRAAERIVDRVIRGDSPSEEDDRAQAIGEIGRALALDPHQVEARRALVKLISTPPSVPLSGIAELSRRADEAEIRESGRLGVIAYAAWLMFAPFYVLMGTQDIVLGAITWGGIVLTMVVNAIDLFSTRYVYARTVVGLALTTLVVACLSRTFGPLVLIPSIAASNTICYAVSPIRKLRPLIVASGPLAILIPATLEWCGVLERSYSFHDGLMIIHPHLAPYPPATSIVLLTLAAIASSTISTWFMMRMRVALSNAQTQLQVHAWHFSRLVPPRPSESDPVSESGTRRVPHPAPGQAL